MGALGLLAEMRETVDFLVFLGRGFLEAMLALLGALRVCVQAAPLLLELLLGVEASMVEGEQRMQRLLRVTHVLPPAVPQVHWRRKSC